MRKCLTAIILTVLMIPGFCFAQKAGSFVAGFDAGLTSAMGDFNNDTLDAGTGIGFGGEVRYSLLNNVSFGPFIRYQRFGKSTQGAIGSISYNFVQYGGLLRMNLFDLSKGKLFFIAGAGLFKPNIHTWTPDHVTDESYESGIFYSGGFGLCTNPYASTIYAFELRYSTGDADFDTGEAGTDILSQNFSFISLNIKMSFNSQGIKPPPRY